MAATSTRNTENRSLRLKQQQLSGWGRYPVQECLCYRPEKLSELGPLKPESIPRGQGKSYGDAALNAGGNVVLTERINRFIAFDQQQGTITVEAGVTLAELLDFLVPRGWFLPVVPGTAGVSVGGCIAADVHGKNQHRYGNFAQSVQCLELILASGETLEISAQQHEPLFRATTGGMGLTGLIKSATLRLLPINSSYMLTQNFAAPNLEALLDIFAQRKDEDPYSVAWLDCLSEGEALGRGIYTSGRHAEPGEIGNYSHRPLAWHGKNRNLPLPGILSLFLQPVTARRFNQRYYRRHAARTGVEIQPAQKYFFPLDSFDNWNRLYGKNGFIQYQCVVAEKNADKALRSLLETLQRAGIPVYLGVLKRFGRCESGYLSFPMPGYTLALDIPAGSDAVLATLKQLDDTVIRHQGRVYLAKDARLDSERFAKMYPLYSQWQRIKQEYDPDCLFNSSLYKRLTGKPH